MVTQVVRQFQPRQLVQGAVRIRNTGNTPVTLGVRVTPGMASILGFSPEVGGQTVITPRPVGPGDTVSLPVTIRLPETPGSKSFRVEVGEVDLAGRLFRVIDTQDFANLAEVLSALPEPAMVPLPGEPALPALPQPDLAMQFQESLGQGGVSFVEQSVCQGDPFLARFSLPTGAPAPFSVEMRVVLMNALGQAAQSLNLGRIGVQPGQTINRDFSIPTTGLPVGGYSLNVSLIDPNAGTVLFGPINVPGLQVLDCPPVGAPVAGGQFGRPTISVFPFNVTQGATTRLTVRISNATPTPTNPVLNVSIFNSASGARVRGVPDIRLSLSPLQDISQQLPINTTGLPNGLYGFRVSLVAADGSVLVPFVDFSSGFQVSGAAALEPTPTGVEPTPTAPVPTAPTRERLPVRGEISLSYQGSQPRSPSRGSRVGLIFNMINSGPGRGNLRVVAFPRDGSGRLRQTITTNVTVGPNVTSGFVLIIAEIPEDSPPGAWSVGIQVNTASSSLLTANFRNLFTIGAAPAPTPEPIVTAVPTAEPTPVAAPTTTVSGIANVSISGRPRAIPFTVEPGGTTTIQFFAVESNGISQRTRFTVSARDPNGRTRGIGSTTVTIPGGRTTGVSVRVTLFSTSPPGTYSLRIGWVDADGGTFQGETFTSIFAVSS